MHSKTGDLQKSLMYQHCEVISISFDFSRNLDYTMSSWQLVKFATVDCGLMNTSMKRSHNGFMKRFAATNNLSYNFRYASAEDPTKIHAINLSCMHIMSAKESGMSQRIRTFRLESNGTVIFRKIRSEIKDYLRDSPLFPFSKERR